MAKTTRGKRWLKWTVGGVLLLLLVGAGILNYYFGPFPLSWNVRPETPAALARWPWPRAAMDQPHPGVTHWLDRSADGTVVELFDFDFRANPRLRLELYDQDEDDRVPFDDKAEFWRQGVGQATRHLNETGRGQVVAAWNGLFFQYTGTGPHRVGRHVAPVVLHGQARYNVGVVRWAFGVKYTSRGPVFQVRYQPAISMLARDFDFAAEGASCLINQGRPLRLEPFPRPGEDPFPPSKSTSPAEAGFVRQVDHIRTSRTSMAWSRDNRHFYLLIVKEPDSEPDSIYAFANRLPVLGGWTVADEQRFWTQFGAWGAVNIDGGNVTQLTALRPDGKYDLVPSRWADRRQRLTCAPDFANAPTGGTLMYFFIRDRER
ncbi:MAG TPA: phosphodiester glycosidase family protein [Armatimonadota bacterium]|jgi:hypothetical protein